MSMLSFQQALADSKHIKGKRHLLLGNGFSIACRPEAFQYGRLVEAADFSSLSVDATALFEFAGTSDFERAIEALRTTEEIVNLYGSSDRSSLVARLDSDIRVLRNALAEALSKRHPDNVGEISKNEYESARNFLAHFDGNLYTVSYDLLLYWTLMQEFEPVIKSDDGFREDPDDPDAEWVTWDGFAGHEQRIYHLHGGLHLYDAGSFLKKLTWSRSGTALVEQIRDALDSAIYPLVVTEGLSTEKLRHIEHSPYLHRGLKSLVSCGGSLFIHGHSLADNDEHVLRRIEEGKIQALYISLHGDPTSAESVRIQNRAQLMSERRDAHESPKQQRYRRPLTVKFYDAETASVWTG